MYTCDQHQQWFGDVWPSMAEVTESATEIVHFVWTTYNDIHGYFKLFGVCLTEMFYTEVPLYLLPRFYRDSSTV